MVYLRSASIQFICHGHCEASSTSTTLNDCLIAHLRAIPVSNAFASDENKLVTQTNAGIHNIHRTLEMNHKGHLQMLQLVTLIAPAYLTPGISPVANTADGEFVSSWTTMELAFTVTNFTLELFDPTLAVTETARNNSIAKFSLNGIHVNWKSQSDQSMASEILFKTFRTIDTRTWKTTKFQEIIPVADCDGDQLVLSYNQSAANSNVILELKSPNVILLTRASHQRTSKSTLQDDQLASNFSYRIDIIKTKLTLISDPKKSNSDAVYLIIEKILVSQTDFNLNPIINSILIDGHSLSLNQIIWISLDKSILPNSNLI
ncbi:hypothetical protein O181_068998 [Austropuccinia psidii MF-1]|uniref:Uncharacterized protein n=1 Tax=Austropuccinia psidii MF-1 TaxID=1389203 RepID=A0A9Q3I5Y7_9BASI|nr:hypothetical protein [Austropuccinia psidii MF-1]